MRDREREREKESELGDASICFEIPGNVLFA